MNTEKDEDNRQLAKQLFINTSSYQNSLPKTLRRKNSNTPKKAVPVKYSPTRDMQK